MTGLKILAAGAAKSTYFIESGQPAQLTDVFHPANSTLTIAKSQRGKISAFGLDFDNSGRSAFSAPFAWAG